MEKIQKWFIPDKTGNLLFDKYIKAIVITDLSSGNICKAYCPYYGLCDKIPDPRDINNITLSSFMDFCMDYVGSDENSFIPIEGSIEEFLDKEGYDLYQSILKYNPRIELKTVIDKVCKGWCESYDPSYCNCKSSNFTCILRNLFENNK